MPMYGSLGDVEPRRDLRHAQFFVGKSDGLENIEGEVHRTDPCRTVLGHGVVLLVRIACSR